MELRCFAMEENTMEVWLMKISVMLFLTVCITWGLILWEFSFWAFSLKRRSSALVKIGWFSFWCVVSSRTLQGNRIKSLWVSRMLKCRNFFWPKFLWLIVSGIAFSNAWFEVVRRLYEDFMSTVGKLKSLQFLP